MQTIRPATNTASGQQLDQLLVNLEALTQALVRAWNSSNTETTSILQFAKRLEEAVERFCATFEDSEGNGGQRKQVQLRFLKLLQEVAACFSKPCDHLFIDNPGDNDSTWATATMQEAAKYLESTNKPLLEAVIVVLRAIKNAVPIALQGLTFDQNHADNETADTNPAFPVREHPTVDTLLQEVNPIGRLQGKRRNTATTRVVIEVLNSTTDNANDSDMHDAATLQACMEAAKGFVRTTVLACVTWHTDQRLPLPFVLPVEPNNNNGDTGGKQSNGLQAGQNSSTSLALLQSIAANVKLPDTHKSEQGRSPVSRKGGLPRLDHIQRLLCWACIEAGLLHDVRKVLTKSTVPGQPIPPLKDQVLAAKQMSVLIYLIDKKEAASYSFPTVLSAILAAVDAGSPAVAVHGMWALHDLAVVAPSSDLQWQSQLLQDTARRLVVGCQECVWHLACRTATAIMTAVLGDDVRAPGYHALMSEMLNEVERHAHQAEWRLDFMSPEVAHALVKSMKLTVLRHTNRMLPLLLEWCQAADEASRTAAVQTLHVLLCHIWPRAPAHAATLWHHLSTMCLREAAATCITHPPRTDPSRPADSGAACQNVPQHAGDSAPKNAEELDAEKNTGSSELVTNQYVQEVIKQSAPACWVVKCCELLAYCGQQPYKQAVCDTAAQLQTAVVCDTQHGHNDQAQEFGEQTQTAAFLVKHNAKLLPYAQGLVDHVQALLIHDSLESLNIAC